MSSLIASFMRCSLMKCPIYYSKLDPALHASAHHGALPFPLPTGTESDLDVAVEIATALVALGEVRSSDPKLEAALTYLEETHSLALKKEDAKAEAPS